MQRSRVFDNKHGEGGKFASLKGGGKRLGDTEKTVGTGKGKMFTSFDRRYPVLHARSASDIAGGIVFSVSRVVIGVIELTIGESGKSERVRSP